MTRNWLQAMFDATREGTIVRAVVAACEGSCPREVGASMLVWLDRTEGTIGGGSLEYDVIAAARTLLAAPQTAWLRDLRSYHLGPDLNQCCGGAVTVLLERFGAEERGTLGGLMREATPHPVPPPQGGRGRSGDYRALQSAFELPSPALVADLSAVGAASSLTGGDTTRRDSLPPCGGGLGWGGNHVTSATRVARPVTSGMAIRAAATGATALVTGEDGSIWFEERLGETRTPLFIYGAGHVARALVRVLDGLPFEVTWIDVAEDRFPAEVPTDVREIVSDDPAVMVAGAGPDAFHLVMTHSHELDEAIVEAILRLGSFAYLGLIGSATKAARFRQRLGRAGLSADLIGRMVSPIGLPGIAGKAPAVIAVSVAADLMMRRRPKRMPVDGSRGVD